MDEDSVVDRTLVEQNFSVDETSVDEIYEMQPEPSNVSEPITKIDEASPPPVQFQTIPEFSSGIQILELDQNFPEEDLSAPDILLDQEEPLSVVVGCPHCNCLVRCVLDIQKTEHNVVPPNHGNDHRDELKSLPIGLDTDNLIAENQSIYTTVVELYTSFKQLYCQLRADNLKLSSKLSGCSELFSSEPFRIFPLPMESPSRLLQRYSAVINDDLELLKEAFLGVYEKVIPNAVGAIYEGDTKSEEYVYPAAEGDVIPNLINTFMNIDTTIIMLLVKCSYSVRGLQIKQVSPAYSELPENLLCRYVGNVKNNIVALSAQFPRFSALLSGVGNQEPPKVVPTNQSVQQSKHLNGTQPATTQVQSAQLNTKPSAPELSHFHTSTVLPSTDKEGCIANTRNPKKHMPQTGQRPPQVRVINAFKSATPKLSLAISDVSFPDLDHGFVTDYKQCPEGNSDVILTMATSQSGKPMMPPTKSIMDFKNDHIYTIVVAGGGIISVPVLNVYSYKFKEPERGKAHVFLINTDVVNTNQLFTLSVRNADSKGHGTFLSEEVFNLENIQAQERLSGFIPTGKPIDILLQDKSLRTLWMAQDQVIPSDVMVCSLILMGEHSSPEEQQQQQQEEEGYQEDDETGGAVMEEDQDGEIHSLIPILKIDIKRSSGSAPFATYNKNTLVGTRKYSSTRDGPSFGSIVTQEELSFRQQQQQQQESEDETDEDEDSEAEKIPVNVQNVLLLQTIDGKSLSMRPRQPLLKEPKFEEESSEANSGAIQFSQPPAWEPKETIPVPETRAEVRKNGSMTPSQPSRFPPLDSKTRVQPIGAPQNAITKPRPHPNRNVPNSAKLDISIRPSKNNQPMRKFGSPVPQPSHWRFGEDSNSEPKLYQLVPEPNQKTQPERNKKLRKDDDNGQEDGNEGEEEEEVPDLLPKDPENFMKKPLTKDISITTPPNNNVFRVKPKDTPVTKEENELVEKLKTLIPLKGYSAVVMLNDLGYPVTVKSDSDQVQRTFTIDKIIETMLPPGKYRFVASGNNKHGKAIPAFSVDLHESLNYFIKFQLDQNGAPFIPIAISRAR